MPQVLVMAKAVRREHILRYATDEQRRPAPKDAQPFGQEQRDAAPGSRFRAIAAASLAAPKESPVALVPKLHLYVSGCHLSQVVKEELHCRFIASAANLYLEPEAFGAWRDCEV